MREFVSFSRRLRRRDRFWALERRYTSNLTKYDNYFRHFRFFYKRTNFIFFEIKTPKTPKKSCKKMAESKGLSTPFPKKTRLGTLPPISISHVRSWFFGEIFLSKEKSRFFGSFIFGSQNEIVQKGSRWGWPPNEGKLQEISYRELEERA